MTRNLFAGLLAAATLLIAGAAEAPAPVDAARLLDETPAPTLDAYRLFADAGARTPNAGLTPYALNSPLFSDYALKYRYLYLPPGIKVSWRDQGVLDIPVGGALVKTFAYPADFRQPDKDVRFIETRLLIHRASGWVAFSYAWNKEQTQAVLKRAGARVPVSFIDKAGATVAFQYGVPNVNQCKECHSLDKAMTPIGPKARNLNGDFAYAEGAENQLAHWTRTGILTGAPPLASVEATPHYDDPKTPLKLRALAYLDANCAHCHQARGMANNSGLFLDFDQPDQVARGLGKRPVAAGKASNDLDFDIAPGAPDKSILIHRMESREPGVMMPEIGRSLPHAEGVKLIRDYIASLPAG